MWCVCGVDGWVGGWMDGRIAGMQDGVRWWVGDLGSWEVCGVSPGTPETVIGKADGMGWGRVGWGAVELESWRVRG